MISDLGQLASINDKSIVEVDALKKNAIKQESTMLYHIYLKHNSSHDTEFASIRTVILFSC